MAKDTVTKNCTCGTLFVLKFKLSFWCRWVAKDTVTKNCTCGTLFVLKFKLSFSGWRRYL